jgi:hypothetical protein
VISDSPGQTSPEVAPVPRIDKIQRNRATLETNARGVQIGNSRSQYDIPWAAVRDVDIVEAMWRGTGSPYGYALRFIVARDTNPEEPSARPEGSGPDTVDPSRFEPIIAEATAVKTSNIIIPKPRQADLNLEDLRNAILAARDAALADHSSEGAAVEVSGRARILWDRPGTRLTLKRIQIWGLFLLLLVLTVIQYNLD